MTEISDEKIVNIKGKPKKELIDIHEEDAQITEEEHLMEEQRLNNMVETYFMANPSTQFYQATEEEDDEDDDTEQSLDVTDSPSQIKEVDKNDFVKDSIMHGIVLGLIEELNREQTSVREALNKTDAGQNLPGTVALDNIYDAYRKERNHLTSIISFDGKVLVENAPKHIKERVESRTQKVMSELSRELVSGDFINKYHELSEANKGMQSAIHILMDKVNELELAISQLVDE